MTIDAKQFEAPVVSGSGSNGSNEKPVLSIRTKTGKINDTSYFSKRRAKGKFAYQIAKDRKSIAIVPNKDGGSFSTLKLRVEDIEKLGLKKGDFTIQFFSRFVDKSNDTIIIDLTKTSITTDNSK